MQFIKFVMYLFVNIQHSTTFFLFLTSDYSSTTVGTYTFADFVEILYSKRWSLPQLHNVETSFPKTTSRIASGIGKQPNLWMRTKHRCFCKLFRKYKVRCYRKIIMNESFTMSIWSKFVFLKVYFDCWILWC